MYPATIEPRVSRISDASASPAFWASRPNASNGSATFQPDDSLSKPAAKLVAMDWFNASFLPT